MGSRQITRLPSASGRPRTSPDSYPPALTGWPGSGRSWPSLRPVLSSACGCRKSRPRSCGERVFVDDAAGAVVSADSEGVEVGDGRWCRLEGCGLVEGSVRAVLVVMSFVFAENPQ